MDIDRVLDEIEKIVESHSEWCLDLVPDKGSAWTRHAGKEQAAVWETDSPVTAGVIAQYLVSLGMSRNQSGVSAGSCLVLWKNDGASNG